MTISVEQIDLWRGSASETKNLEFKEDGNQYDTRKLCRYCVAIANEGGGHLVSAIAGKPPRAVVFSIPARLEQGLVKSDHNAPDSRRYARYIPVWA